MKTFQINITYNSGLIYSTDSIISIINLNNYASGMANYISSLNNIMVMHNGSIEPKYITNFDPNNESLILRISPIVCTDNTQYIQVRYGPDINDSNSGQVFEDIGLISDWVWDSGLGCYFDLCEHGNLISSGVETITGEFWKAGLYSSGSYSYSDTAGSFNGGSPFSILCTQKPTEINRIYGLMGKRRNNGSDCAGFEWYINENNKLCLELCSDMETNNMIKLESNESVGVSGEWGIYYLSYPGVGTNLSLLRMGYNGQLLTFTSGSYANLTSTFFVSNNFYLGSMANGSGSLIGSQSESHIYNKEISYGYFRTFYESVFNPDFYTIEDPFLIGGSVSAGAPTYGYKQPLSKKSKMSRGRKEITKQYNNRLANDYKNVDFLKV